MDKRVDISFGIVVVIIEDYGCLTMSFLLTNINSNLPINFPPEKRKTVE